MTKFSIIVPVYQAQDCLERCLQSLIRQTLEDLEIILVDDGSTDDSPSICDRYADLDSRIQVIHKQNEGVARARNDGLDAASGEWVLFCDADDWMEPGACELLYRTGRDKQVDVALGDIHLYQNGRKSYNQFFGEEFVWRSRRRLDELVAADLYQAYNPLPPATPSIGCGGPWNKAVRREFLLQKNIRFDPALGGIFDDILYTACLYLYASGVAYIQRPVYNYVLNSASITRRFLPDTLAVNRQIFRAFSRLIQGYTGDGDWQNAYYALVIRRLEESLRLYFFHPQNPDSLSRRLSLLKKTLQARPYCTAVCRADRRKLTPSQKNMLFFLRLPWPGGLWFFYWLKARIRRI